MELDVRLYTCYKDDNRFELIDFQVTLLAFTLFGGKKIIAALIYEIQCQMALRLLMDSPVIGANR